MASGEIPRSNNCKSFKLRLRLDLFGSIYNIFVFIDISVLCLI